MKRHWWLLGRIVALLLLVVAVSDSGAQLPPSKGAPRVGEKAPGFTLPDTSGKPVKLSELLAAPTASQSGAKPQGVLLVFYRGYW